MIEMMILAMIASVVVKRGAEDLIHSARGGTPPRYAAASARRKSGAAARYWGQLWDDAWGDLSKRHAEKRARRDIQAPRADRDPSKMRTVLATAGDDVGRWARATWRHGWDKLDRKQQARRLRPRPGQQTVPGTVVPNRPSRPEDEDRPRPEVQDEDEDDSPVPQDETTDPTDPGQQDDSFVPDYPPDSGPDNQTSSPLASTTTQEGTTMTTTMPTDTEVVSLSKAIHYSESTARVAAEMVNNIDFTQANLAAGGVTGIAVDAFASAKENFGSIAAAMTSAAAEFKAQLAIQEAYNANPGAGSKEFIMGHR